ncbi:hypothetical protein TIFTF001_037804, partial [Ficus carica]
MRGEVGLADAWGEGRQDL